jgi:DNA invertase Pin-like site-specific DNA recombinase
MDRRARNVDDLRRIVLSETRRRVRIHFIKENLIFTGDESPMANLMLSVLGAVAQFERDLIRERRREGIALAKQRGAYTGRKKALIPERVQELCTRVGNGKTKAALVREFEISRETLYQYLRQNAGRKAVGRLNGIGDKYRTRKNAS